MTELTQAHLKSVLDYDPETGVFTWKNRSDIPRNVNAGRVGKEAGCVADYVCTQYLLIGINGVLYKAHRLAWFYLHGRWPEGDIDHRNCDGLDNRIVNLREASRRQNLANMRVKGRIRIKGVSRSGKNPRKPFQAQIRIGGKRKWLGYYSTAEEAGEVYM